MSDRINLAGLQRDASALVDAARRAGADACDCVVAHGQSLGVSVREGEVENTSRSEADEFSLRVFCGKKVASISANTLSDIDGLAERAVAMAKVSPEDPYEGLAPKESLAKSFDAAALELSDTQTPDADRLRERALACESAGLAVKGVAKSMGASAGWGISGFVLATSSGFEGFYDTSRFSASTAMLAGEGTAMERDYEFHSATHEADLFDAETIGARAGEKAVRRLGAKQAQSGQVPVIFDRRVSTGLLGSLTGAINGAAVARKTSFLRDAMGKKVANERITIRDDPARRRGLGSRPFDGEGMACLPMTLVENGVLQEWLLDWASARQLELESNGRASRGGSGTSPSTTNCNIEAGNDSPQEMIASVKNGLFLTETIGHGINMVTGDYSKGASGFWIENGEITYPVSEITIAGNLRDMFINMVPANDLEFRYAANSPTLYVEGMTIGGK